MALTRGLSSGDRVTVGSREVGVAFDDRGRKFEHYRRIASLQEYVLVSQKQPRVEAYRRQGEREWLLTEGVGLEESVELPSVRCVLSLAEVYERVL